jgi:hypothetical protein
LFKELYRMEGVEPVGLVNSKAVSN